MGKIQGIVGGISGKMGNAVFRQRNGETVISQYQPIVKNPNTIAQQNARAAFKLATQLSAIMAPAIGTMGVINRPARPGRNPRNGFVSRNYSLISTTPDPTSADKVTANIAMEKVQLTDSSKQFGSIQLSRLPQGSIQVQVFGLPSLGSGSISAKIVLVGYETLATGGRRAYVHSMVDVPKAENSEENSEEITFNYTFEELEAGADYTVLTYGMLQLSTGKAKVDYNNIHTPSDENFISSIVIDQSLAEGSMEVTNTIGANITTAAE